jgi:hypothetical protein
MARTERFEPMTPRAEERWEALKARRGLTRYALENARRNGYDLSFMGFSEEEIEEAEASFAEALREAA